MQKAIVKAMADAAVRQIKSMTLAITAGLKKADIRMNKTVTVNTM